MVQVFCPKDEIASPTSSNAFETWASISRCSRIICNALQKVSFDRRILETRLFDIGRCFLSSFTVQVWFPSCVIKRLYHCCLPFLRTIQLLNLSDSNIVVDHFYPTKQLFLAFFSGRIINNDMNRLFQEIAPFSHYSNSPRKVVEFDHLVNVTTTPGCLGRGGTQYKLPPFWSSGRIRKKQVSPLPSVQPSDRFLYNQIALLLFKRGRQCVLARVKSAWRMRK